jgi:SPX domain protein involved in polyphosphate accumulation
MQEIFERIEEKYILTKAQKERLLELVKDHLKDDEYGPSTVCNIYFDNKNKDLVRTSLDKPFYKEKVRLRSYNVPNGNSTAFLEIKKKCDGIVYKRRIANSLDDIEGHIGEGREIDSNKQIVNEIDYCFRTYQLEPALFLSYDRVAYYDKDDSSFRLTFDTNITARDYDLDLSKGVYGTKYCDENTYIMEIKCAGGLPFWFLRALQEVKAYPGSFSKYGKVYEANMLKASKAF